MALKTKSPKMQKVDEEQKKKNVNGVAKTAPSSNVYSTQPKVNKPGVTSRENKNPNQIIGKTTNVTNSTKMQGPRFGNDVLQGTSQLEALQRYEDIPNYNVLERAFNKEKSDAYKEKQALRNSYEQMKNKQTSNMLADYGIDYSSLHEVDKNVGGNSQARDKALRKYLREKGITNEEDIKAIQLMYRTGLQNDTNNQLTKFTDEHPVGGTLASFPLKYASGITGTLENLGQYIAGTPLSNTDPANAFDTSIDAMRESASKDMGNVGKFLYSGLTSIGDMGLAMAGGRDIAPIIQATQKAENVMNDAISRGLNPLQTIEEGLASGLSTYGTEKIPMGKIADIAEGVVPIQSATDLLKAIGASALTEGLQEGAEDLVDRGFDALIARDKSSYNLDKQALMKNGMSEEEAKRTMFENIAKEIGTDMLAGGLTGGVLGGLGGGMNIARGKANAKADNIAFDRMLEERRQNTEKGFNDILNKQRERLAQEEVAKQNEAIANRIEEERKANQPTSLEELMKEVPVENVAEEVAPSNVQESAQEIPQNNPIAFTDEELDEYANLTRRYNQEQDYRKKKEIEDEMLSIIDNAERRSQNVQEEVKPPELEVLQNQMENLPYSNSAPENEQNNYVQYGNGEKKVQGARANNFEGNLATDEEANTYFDTSDFEIETDSDADSLERAKSSLASDPEYANKLMEKSPVDFQNHEVDALFMEYIKARDMARQDGSDETWKKASSIYKKLADVGTEGGRVIEAFKKWKANTTEGIVDNLLRETRNNLKRSIGEKKTKAFMDKFIDEHLKGITELAEEGKTAGVDTREGKIAFAKIGKIIDKESPKTIRGRITTVLMDNMLGNFRTLVSRNAGGNVGYNAMEFLRQPITALADRVVSKKTGVRERTGWSTDKIASAMKGAWSGIKNEALDLAQGVHTSKSGESPETAIGLNQHSFSTNHQTKSVAVNKGLNAIGIVANKLDDLVKHGLSVGDRPFYEAAYAQRKTELNSLREKGLLGEDVAKLTDAQFEQVADLSAKLDGLTATYQDDSSASKALTELKSFAQNLSTSMFGIDILSQFSSPFVRTPGNIIQRSIEYSPIGAVKNTIETLQEVSKDNFNQQRFVDELGRNVLGTALFTAGLELAKNGIVNGAYDEDKDIAQEQKNNGMIEYGLNYKKDGKDMNMDISWLPVVGNDLIMASAVNQYLKEHPDDTKLDAFTNATGEALSTLWNQSAMQGAQRLTGGSNAYSSEGFGANIKNTIESGLSQLQPSLDRQVANALDPYQRNISDGERSYTVNNLISGSPFLRQRLLEPKVDNEGNLMLNNQGRGLASRLVENMLIPATIKERSETPISEEVIRLKESTRESKQFVPTPNRKDLVKTDANGNEVPISDKEFTEYKKMYGQAITSVGDKLLNSDMYKGLSDDAKVEVLSEAWSGVKAYSMENAGIKESNNKFAKLYKEKGIDEAVQYVLEGNHIKDNTVNGDASELKRKIYETDGDKGLENYNKATEIFNSYDITSNKNITEEMYKTYTKKGEGALKQMLAEQEVVDRANLPNTETVKKIIDNYGDTEIPVLQKAVNDITSIEIGEDEYGDTKYASVTEKNYGIYKDKGKRGVETYYKISDTDFDGDGKKGIYNDYIPSIMSMNLPDEDAGYYLRAINGDGAKGAQQAYEQNGDAGYYQYYVDEYYKKLNKVSKEKSSNSTKKAQKQQAALEVLQQWGTP